MESTQAVKWAWAVIGLVPTACRRLSKAGQLHLSLAPTCSVQNECWRLGGELEAAPHSPLHCGQLSHAPAVLVLVVRLDVIHSGHSCTISSALLSPLYQVKTLGFRGETVIESRASS